jgi:hypothetical protein
MWLAGKIQPHNKGSANKAVQRNPTDRSVQYNAKEDCCANKAPTSVCTAYWMPKKTSQAAASKADHVHKGQLVAKRICSGNTGRAKSPAASADSTQLKEMKPLEYALPSTVRGFHKSLYQPTKAARRWWRKIPANSVNPSTTQKSQAVGWSGLTWPTNPVSMRYAKVRFLLGVEPRVLPLSPNSNWCKPQSPKPWLHVKTFTSIPTTI